jgi:hypothetical protein
MSYVDKSQLSILNLNNIYDILEVIKVEIKNVR